MKTIILVEAADMIAEYNVLLLETLKKYVDIYSEDKSELIIATNMEFVGGGQITDAFNLYLKKLQFENTIQIKVRL